MPVVGLEHIEPDEIWLRKWEVNPDENTFSKAFRKGQLLFGRRRAYQKKLSLAPSDGICSGDITVIAAKSDKVVPSLLPFLLRTDKFFDYAIQGSAGSLSPRVKWAHLAKYEFDLPPMDEQKKLAELLWAANDLKESYKKAITATDEMLKAKFREMFGKCPQVSLASVCKGSGEYGIAASADDYDVKKGRYIRITDIMDDGSLNDDVVSPDKYEEKFILKEDDILFARTGNTVGKTYIHKRGHATFAGYLIRYEVDQTKMLPDYLFAYTHTNEYYFWVAKTKKIGAQPNINAMQYDGMTLPCPSLALQREFVAIADKAESAKTNLKKSIAAIDQVMKGLINQ